MCGEEEDDHLGRMVIMGGWCSPWREDTNYFRDSDSGGKGGDRVGRRMTK